MLFLCDEMCAHLGRWLRAAGYDTVIIETSLDDLTIYKKAIAENRHLLTRDKHFKKIDPENKTIIYLRGEELSGWAIQLKEEIGVNWLYAAFTRCLKCNIALHQVDKPFRLTENMPKDITDLWKCPECRKLFWKGSHTENMQQQLESWENQTTLTIGLGGDLMIGRLVNNELNVVNPAYVWGNLLPIMRSNDLNFVNLETTLTRSLKRIPKVFNFKADPEKVDVLTEGHIQIVNIANNHILDYSEEGFLETIRVLDQARILYVGAGKNFNQAKAPCIIEKFGINVGFLGCTDNEPTWKASLNCSGTNYLDVGDLTSIRESIVNLRKEVDLLILSIHWGPNMRQRPLPNFRKFAHDLIDLGVDIIHGHSAHIFQGVEVYKNKLILYDTGDLIDDYAVDPILRNDQSFYFIVKADNKRILSLKMIPTLISNCQVNISTDSGQLDRMEMLCKELKTSINRKNNCLEVLLPL